MERSRMPELLLLAELALAGTTIAAAWGLSRLLEGDGFLLPIMASAVLAHVIAAGLRRISLPAPAAALAIPIVMGLGLILLVTWGYYRDTTAAFLPSGATLDALRIDIDTAWSQFGEVKAPAPALTGFVVACIAGVWMLAFLADTIAFRVWISLEALAPAVVSLVFVAMVGSPDGQVPTTIALVATMLIFLLFHRIYRQDRSVNWLADDTVRGTRSLVRIGLAVAVVATVLAAAIGPRIPGSETAAWDWESINDEPDGRVVQSPLVSIQDRLVNQQRTEVFTVATDSPAYWRTMSLDEFTGTIWKAQGSYDDVSGSLPGGAAPNGDAPPGIQEVNQNYEVTNLSQLWMPAALQAKSIEITSGNVDDARYHPGSSTLTVGLDRTDSDGLTYEVRSEVPIHNAALLGSANTEIPAEIADRYLGLPADFSPDITAQAREIARGATSTFGQALALQDFFRTFTYDLNVHLAVANKHSSSIMEEFLRQQRGYCEQFAGTFAAMARSLGIPARVAVGFTWGEEIAGPDANGLRTYSVQGRHSHAWPEVYISGFGWVPFEPTPGRSMPGEQRAHTGIGEDLQDQTPAEQAAEEALTTSTTVAADDPSAQATPTSAAPARPERAPVEAVTPVAPKGDPWWLGFVRTVGIVIGLAALYIGAVLGWRAMVKRRRHARAITPDQRAQAAWADALDELDHVGARPQQHETHHEFATRATVLLPESEAPTEVLAGHLAAATYRADGVGDSEADECQEAATEVATLVRKNVSPTRRGVRALRPPLPKGR